MSEDDILVAVSGYFDPLHPGHINLFKEAKKLGDELIVVINNDDQTISKKGYVFMEDVYRQEIIKNLEMVDYTFIAIDSDGTVCKTLEAINPDIFANGGDRDSSEVPESKVCRNFDIEMVDNVGGDKIASSSDMVKSAIESVIKIKN